MYLREAIPVGGRVSLRLRLCILPLIVCSSTAAWRSPPYPWTCLQVLGRCRDGRLSFEFPRCGPCARDCRNLLSSLFYYITTQAATQAVTKGNCIAMRNRSNRRGGLAAVNGGMRVHCCDIHWATPFIQSQADATRPSYGL